MTAFRSRGLGVSPGLAIGRAIVLEGPFSNGHPSTPVDRDHEWNRIDATIRLLAPSDRPEELPAARLEGIASVEVLREHLRRSLKAHGSTAESAVLRAALQDEKVSAMVKTDFAHERLFWLSRAAVSVLRLLFWRRQVSEVGPKKGGVAVLQSASLETVLRQTHAVLAFVVEKETVDSDLMQLCRLCRVPLVAGLEDATRRIQMNDAVRVCGDTGDVEVLVPRPRTRRRLEA